MKKNIISFFALLFFTFGYTNLLFAQSLQMRLANRHFDALHYAKAVTIYEDAYEKDTTNWLAERRIAACYRHLNMSEQAETWYAKVVAREPLPTVYKLYYAEALAENGKYEKAQQWYRAYAEDASTDKRGQRFYQSYYNLTNFYKDSSRFTITPAHFNSSEADFSPVYFENNLIFCSNRHEEVKKGVRRYFGWSNTSFLDLYKVSEDGGTPEKFHEEINTRYHEGPLAFFDNNRQVVFTRNNFHNGKYGKSAKGINKLKLYFAKNQEGEWTSIKEFTYNSDEYSTGHPTFSSDEQLLYFVSDMPGGYGGTDIYVSRKEGGKWSKPVNLGPEINTEGEEMFPFVDEEGNLFFASSGHAGLGGLDIFIAEASLLADGFLPPYNMGYPLNSNQDDFGLVFKASENKGYFTSHDRMGGSGDDDIFQFTWTRPKDVQLVGITLNAETREPLKAADVLLSSTSQSQSNSYATDDLGTFRFNLPYGDGYQLFAEMEGFERGSTTLVPSELRKFSNGDTIEILLKPIEREKEKADLILFHVYYDFDKYEIRPDAAAYLNQVADFLKSFPASTLTVQSHADNRGTNEYNEKLAKRRAKAATDYLISRGVERNRINQQGFGENRPDIPCENCDETSHQYNRRTEFIINVNGKEVKSVKPGEGNNKKNRLIDDIPVNPKTEKEEAFKKLNIKEDAYLSTKGANKPGYVLDSFNYNENSTDIPIEGYYELKQVAEFMKYYPNYIIEIGAFTSNQGDENMNILLSRKRSKVIVDYLIDTYDIEPDRLKAVGYGKLKPRGNNADDYQQVLNNRIEVKIVGELEK